MEPKGLLQCSQEPAIGPYPEPDESSVHTDSVICLITFNKYRGLFIRETVLRRTFLFC
jgi:hypothetical protein